MSGSATSRTIMDRSSVRVLHIDDREAGGAPLTSSSIHRGSTRFDFVTAAGVEAGLALLRTQRFDAVLVDLVSAGGGGLDALARVRQLSLAPVVVLASHEDEALAVRAVQQGAQDFLFKAEIDSGLLVRSIYYAMERNRLHQQVLAGSLSDASTGLLSRAGFLDAARRQVKLAQRAGEPVCLLRIALGAPAEIAADEELGALAALGSILRSTFRESDTLGRTGEREVTVLAPSVSEEGVPILLRRLEDGVALFNSRTGAGGITVRYERLAYRPEAGEELNALLGDGGAENGEVKPVAAGAP